MKSKYRHAYNYNELRVYGGLSDRNVEEEGEGRWGRRYSVW